MFYIEKNEKKVEKFKVKLFESHLLEIRDRLIKDYSTIININDYYCFSNVKKVKSDKLLDYSNNSIKVNFAYHIHPELVILIDMLLSKNVKAIEKIVNYEQKDINLNKLFNETLVNYICNNISNELNVEFNNNDLLSYINNPFNVYINNEDHTFLKDEILKCISFEKVAAIDVNEYYKMLDFLNISSKDVLTYQRKKIKSKDY